MKRGRWAFFTSNDFCFSSKLLLISTILATNLTFAQAQSLQDPAKTAGEAVVASDEVDNKTSSDGSIDATAEKSDSNVSEQQSIGIPLASGIMELLRDEIAGGFKRRNIEPQFGRFQSYAAGKLNATSGPATASEITGNCRLSWYNRLLRDPLTAPGEAEEFTRKLHTAILGRGIGDAMLMAAEKLDLETPAIRVLPAPKTPQAALDVVKQSLDSAQASYAAALAPLTRTEISELARSLYPILTEQNRVGHTLSSRGMGRRLCDLLEKTDQSAMQSAARALVPLTDPAFLDQLARLPSTGSGQMGGVNGTVIGRISTPSGDIVIGGPGDNAYQLDAMANVAAVIDLGGNDTYYEGTCSIQRPVLVLIDLAGNDTYQGNRPGIQGGAVLGISMLLDRSGNDTYQAKDLAQGSCLGGAGILIDYAGDDTYHGVRRLQGQAIGGVGMLIDRAGNDDYHAAMWAQGFGGPIGFGMLDDVDGDDHYYAGGLYLDSYEETPGYEGWSQGIGAGLRQVSNGGIGVILDGGGDDVYEYDYLSHGGGYWLGLGFARDFGGNDQRLGATRKAFNGGSRSERRFQRFSNGFGCHYALGFCFDDQGNDTYNGTIMCVGFAWDVAVGVLCDFDGDDQYSGTEGNGAQAGLGIIFDYGGNDYYQGYKQGQASSSISYHTLPYCGGNFSFVIDYGGQDKYGCGARNDSYNRRSSNGGFLIDRPKQDEIETKETAETKPQGKGKNL